jgi:YVTN family beta-propeller protein
MLGYVANRNSDSVSVLDLDGMALLGTVPVGRSPVDTDGPRHVILDPAASLAYVVLSYPGDIVGPHASAAGATQRAGYVQALALDDLRTLGELRVDPRSEEMSLSPDRTQLAIIHNDTLLALQPGDVEQRRAPLLLIQPATAVATATVDSSPTIRSLAVCVAPTAVVYGADATRAYVACAGEDSLAAVDTQNALVLNRVPAGDAQVNKPYAVVADARAERLAVSNQVSRQLVLFTAADLPVITSSAQLDGVPFFAAWLSDDEIVVPTQNPSGAARVSSSTGAVLQTVTYADDGNQGCNSPSEVRRSADSRLFMVCEGDHYAPGAVVQLDPETLEVIAHVAVGVYPDRLALLPPP